MPGEPGLRRDPGVRETDVRRIATPGQVLAEVGEQILRAGPRAGDRIPSEHELVRALGVSRRRLRGAVETLEHAGLVGGRVDRRTLSAAPASDIGRLLRSLLRGVAIGPRELIEVRTDLERAAAAGAAAAAAAGRSDLSGLPPLVARMRDPALPAAEFGRLDAAFHLHIAQASGNELHAQLMHGLRDAVVEQMSAAFAGVRDWPRTARRLVEEHQRLTDMIMGGCTAKAAELAGAHLNGFYQA
jgi:GntR family transcriptional regulator, transcriptional repressor for pyruvate dehydrogenase complex